MCLSFSFVPGLADQDKKQLRYDCYVDTSQFLRNALWVAMENMHFHIAKTC